MANQIRRWLIYTGIVLVCLVVFQATGILPGILRQLTVAAESILNAAVKLGQTIFVLGIMFAGFMKMVTGRFPWEGGRRR